MNKQLMSGNSAIGEAAIQAGCKFYFGYPITPQNELPEYMSARLPEEKGAAFLQAESEVGAINMVIGASSVGARVMTSSSSPGISLKQEGISYLAGQELPAVIINVVRGGPGLGSIYSAQSDYFQSTRGGGHGDYRTIVLAPASVQELADMTALAFDLADTYRTPVIVSADGVLGQMMEPVRIPSKKGRKKITKDYALTGAKGRPSKAIHSFRMDPKDQEDHNWKLMRKYKRIEQREVRYETFLLDDAEMAVVAYGTAARIARGAINRLRKENLKVGLIRPKTLWPFPAEIIRETAQQLHDFFVFEMSAGQMIDDVKLSLDGSGTIHFYGRPGGVIPSPVELYRIISRHYYQSQRKRGK
jgi:2-oxoglutarate ferredoxin oxidoreductase subunit alpha